MKGRRSGFRVLSTKRFTGQYHENGLTQSEGLNYYGARWYDAKLGRFLSADSIVPSPANPQAFNRYSYVYNNPLKYVDPTGHCGVTSDNVSMQAELGCNDSGGNGIGGRSSNISSGGGWFSGLTKWFSSWRSSSSTSAESPWIQMNPYGAQRTLSASNSVNNARNLIPIELSSSAKPVTIVAQNAQPLIRADLPQTVISAHGQYDPLLLAIRQPEQLCDTMQGRVGKLPMNWAISLNWGRRLPMLCVLYIHQEPMHQTSC